MGLSPGVTTGILVVVTLIALIGAYLSPLKIDHLLTAAGVALIVWGNIFILVGFIAAWRLLFTPSAPGVTATPGFSVISDFAQLVSALGAAPTWLGLTAMGTLQTVVGVWLLKRVTGQ